MLGMLSDLLDLRRMNTGSRRTGKAATTRVPRTPKTSALAITDGDLLPGDVLLYRPRTPNLVQSKISEATGSPYSHAAIYLGGGMIADSRFPLGVKRRKLSSMMRGAQCVAVLRTQLGFGPRRAFELDAFVTSVVGSRKLYDLLGVRSFEERWAERSHNELDFLRANYGKVTTKEAFAKRSFFCSAFIVACYTVVGLIGASAQAAYPPDYFAPGHLFEDPTFGWLLGYLVPDHGAVPADDPLLTQATLWRDNLSARWWP
jgi:hypothetical protein